MTTRIGPLFRRQFLLSSAGTSGATPPFFRHLAVPAGRLSHCPELTVQQVTGADGHPWTLLGTPLETFGDRTAAETLSLTTVEDVVEAYRSWDGRWLLLGEDSVHTDCMGYIPGFYSDSAVASTPGLLAPGQMPRPRLVRGDVCDWFPAPGSGLEGVRRLLPSQVLRLSDRVVRPRPLPLPTDESQEEALAAMEGMLVRAVRAIDAPRLVVPLSAGWDSRLILAACVAAGVEALCVTLGYPGMSRSDRTFPPELAASVGLQHVHVPPGRRHRRSARLYDLQVAGHIVEADRSFLLRDQYHWTRAGDVLLRGLSLDGTRVGFHRELPSGPAEIRTLSATLLPSPVQRQGLEAYLRWLEQDPQPVAWQHRFDLEQGTGAWAATSDVALDLTDGHGINLGNSTAYQSAAFSLPEAYRARSGHHADLIARMAPALLDLPVNPPENRWLQPGRIPPALRRRAVARLRARRADTRVKVDTLT